MRCSKCGMRFGTNDVFCPECGIRVSGKSEAGAAPPPPASSSTPAAPVAAAAVGEPVSPGLAEDAGENMAEPGTEAPPPLPPSPRVASDGRRTSAWAVAALVMGIGAFTFIPLIGAILAIIFAGIAKGSIKRASGQLKGAGMANAGLVLGIVGLVIPLVLAAVVIPIGVTLVLPGLEARDHLLDGVDAARIYYNEHGSYTGVTAAALTEIDDTVDFRALPGRENNAVYVGPATANTVRLYCYSTRNEKFVASANGDRWTYNLGWNWGPFRDDPGGEVQW